MHSGQWIKNKGFSDLRRQERGLDGLKPTRISYQNRLETFQAAVRATLI